MLASPATEACPSTEPVDLNRRAAPTVTLNEDLNRDDAVTDLPKGAEKHDRTR
jgi:hypothetical protein